MYIHPDYFKMILAFRCVGMQCGDVWWGLPSYCARCIPDTFFINNIVYCCIIGYIYNEYNKTELFFINIYCESCATFCL